jgi:hypothetical protein
MSHLSFLLRNPNVGYPTIFNIDLDASSDPADAPGRRTNRIARAHPVDLRAGLRMASKKLLGSDLLPKDLLSATPKQPEAGDSAA